MASAQSITTTAHHGPVVAQTGIAGPLLQALEGAGVAASALYAVVAEGDNEQDSARLVHVLLESLLGAPGGEAVMPLVAPRSWELLFGRANRREMEAF